MSFVDRGLFPAEIALPTGAPIGDLHARRSCCFQDGQAQPHHAACVELTVEKAGLRAGSLPMVLITGHGHTVWRHGLAFALAASWAASVAFPEELDRLEIHTETHVQIESSAPKPMWAIALAAMAPFPIAAIPVRLWARGPDRPATTVLLTPPLVGGGDGFLLGSIRWGLESSRAPRWTRLAMSRRSRSTPPPAG